MRSTAWNTPITVEDPRTGFPTTVKTARHAQRVLHLNWPDTAGSRHRHAELACENAEHGDGAPREARMAFIAAAIEARLHLSS